MSIISLLDNLIPAIPDRFVLSFIFTKSPPTINTPVLGLYPKAVILVEVSISIL